MRPKIVTDKPPASTKSTNYHIRELLAFRVPGGRSIGDLVADVAEQDLDLAGHQGTMNLQIHHNSITCFWVPAKEDTP